MLVGCLTALAACAERELILPGEREDVRSTLGLEEAARSPAGPVTLGPVTVTRAWTHQAGTPDHNPGHAALSGSLQRVWSVDIGAGDARRFRIAAQPVSDGARIFAMDSRSRVTAVSTAGDTLWSRDLTPPGDRADSASGGGLAVAGGRVYATTGFGTLVALDAATGAPVWSHDFRSVASGAPTVANGLVYAITRNGIGWALDARNGRVRWSVTGIATEAGILGGPSPAVGADGLAVFAFPNGALSGVDAATGALRWRGFIAGRRLETVASAIADVTGDPVLSGAVVVAGTHDGRTAAFDRATGAPLWTLDEGAMSAPVVTPSDVFQITDRNALIRIDRDTGDLVWSQPLPLYRTSRPRRFSALFAHYGPILAGGRLVVASDDRELRFFDPATGALAGSLDLPSGAAADPIVVGGTLYLVTENGRLHAFR
ncbi:MAG: PQQ-binding-like beta-propeller repeat protein [Paracoccaceae bacterium]|nr:PQQ-binding-like beta-propeller repeat protein [Paracoccaceae bacterium]